MRIAGIAGLRQLDGDRRARRPAAPRDPHAPRPGRRGAARRGRRRALARVARRATARRRSRSRQLAAAARTGTPVLDARAHATTRSSSRSPARCSPSAASQLPASSRSAPSGAPSRSARSCAASSSIAAELHPEAIATFATAGPRRDGAPAPTTRRPEAAPCSRRPGVRVREDRVVAADAFRDRGRACRPRWARRLPGAGGRPRDRVAGGGALRVVCILSSPRNVRITAVGEIARQRELLGRERARDGLPRGVAPLLSSLVASGWRVADAMRGRVTSVRVDDDEVGLSRADAGRSRASPSCCGRSCPRRRPASRGPRPRRAVACAREARCRRRSRRTRASFPTAARPAGVRCRS